MTTGTRVHGSKEPVVTSAGSTFKYDSYGTKTWSGTDYAANSKTPYIRRPPRERWVEAWVGPRKEKIYLGKRLFPLPEHDPPRKTKEEHPYSMDDSFLSENVYQVGWPPYQPYSTVTPTQDGGTLYVYDWGWTANHDLLLLGKLREKVAGSGFNAGVFLGEAVPALKTIFGAAQGVRWAYEAARKGDFRSAAKNLFDPSYSRHKAPTRKVVANSWLELQYGWLPLINDVYEGAIFMSHYLEVPFKEVRYVRKKSVPKWQLGNSVRYDYPLYEKHMWAVSSKRIKAILEEVNVVTLSGLLDPLPIAWELLPYSFVADWFIPIGNYLQARGLSTALKGTYVTTWYRASDSRRLQLKKPFSYGGGTQNEFHQRRVLVQRSVSTSLSVPLPEVKPLMDVPSWRRAANAVGLVIQKAR